MVQTPERPRQSLESGDRALVNDALRESEARYRTLAENSAVGIWHFRLDGSTVYVNPAMCSLLEIDGPADLENQHHETFFTPESLVTMAREDSSLLRGAVSSYEVELLTRRGRKRSVVISAAPVLDSSGSLGGVIGTFTDITQRKQAEEALRKSDHRAKTLLQALPDILFVMTRDGTFIEVRATNPQDLVAPPEQLLGRNIRDLGFSQASLDQHFGAVDRSFETGLVQSFEFTLETLSGLNHYEERLVALDEQEVLILIRNITQRKRAEQASRESEERWRFIIQNAPDYILTIDCEGKIIFINRAAPGLSVDEVIGTSLYDWILPEGRPITRAAFERVLATGEPTSYENSGLGPGGAPAVYVSRVGPIRRNGQITGLMLVSTDITERKHAEQERLELQAQIQHGQKLESLGVLAGGIAHDFNNLLMGILGNVGLSLMELEPRSRARPYIEKIETVALHAAELTNQMLAYSGRGRFVVQPLDLSRLILDMHNLLEMVISKKARLEFDLSSSLPHIEADATQLRQVLVNLVTNASEAIGDRTGVITVRTASIEASRAELEGVYRAYDLAPGLYVGLSVSDGGCGMDPETLGRIFDPFFTTKFTGRGLGLAAVLGIVRGHHGAIKVASELGHGTSFTVLFPYATNVREEPVQKLRSAQGAGKSGGTILVVDDEEIIRIVVKTALEKFGFNVLTASDGHEAVETFRMHGDEISAVLLDMTMPRMSGDEVFRELRRIRPDIRVILSSGYTEQEATHRFTDQGLSAFIQKPYQPLELLELLQSVLQT